MEQEIPLYDRPEFYAAYLTLPRQALGHDGAPEWPVLRDMVGSVDSQRVLDLGCGLGWFARYAIESDAQFVDAFDISTRMITKAIEMTPKDAQQKVTYEVKDLSKINLREAGYDLVYSSLTFHYLSTPAFSRLLEQLHDSLKPGGRLVFSVEHPIFTAPSNPELQKLPGGSEIWPLDRYANEGLRETNWLGGVRKYHRTMTTYLQELLEAGFTVKGFREWMASEKDLQRYPEWSSEAARPMFLLIKAVKQE